jgi:hypothetical protein
MAGGTFVPELVEDDLIHCKYSEKKGLPGTFRKRSEICWGCDRLLCDSRIAPKGEARPPRVRKANAREFCERFSTRELYHIRSWRNVGSTISMVCCSQSMPENSLLALYWMTRKVRGVGFEPTKAYATG